MKDTKLVIVVRKDLGMRKGKIGAQCGHAAEYFMFDKMSWDDRAASSSTQRVVLDLSRVEADWIRSSHAKVVVSAKDEQELLNLVEQARRAGVKVHTVTDAGRTEFHGVATMTCAAFGPDYVDRLDPITGHLPLL